MFTKERDNAYIIVWEEHCEILDVIIIKIMELLNEVGLLKSCKSPDQMDFFRGF